VGIRLRDLPFTPGKVLEALRASGRPAPTGEPALAAGSR